MTYESRKVVAAIMATFMKGQKYEEDIAPVPVSVPTPTVDEDASSTNSNGSSALSLMKNQPVKFWAALDEMGLLSEITDNMTTSVEHLRRLALMGPSQRDAAELQKRTEVSWRRLEESRRRASRIDDLFSEEPPSSSSGQPKRRRTSATGGATSTTSSATAVIDENNSLSLVEQ
ncbi:unnamed protein product [Gongylonema pulchrum]|uniref:GMEB1/2/Spe-44-like domain-containing protein n=1 Tax=Gongylonema pulchrum TaxID=637853 RepID=A0A183DTL5_9BILA|nr:unnamed protein product [Gongylonema pulchrum]